MGSGVSSTETSSTGGAGAQRRQREGRIAACSSDLSTHGRYHRPPKTLGQDYTVGDDVLGTGFNGSVFRATSRNKRGTFAVKGFNLEGMVQADRREMQGEVEIFLAMDHPHIARLVDVYESEKQLHLVMECMEGGELFDRVTKAKKYTEKESAHSVWQMLLAIKYLHCNGIVHRDLKLENFLYERETNDHLKLIDFGFSKVHDDFGGSAMERTCGTLSYVAPEVLAKNYTSQCDLWSMGVITFILLLGYMPFNGATEAITKRNIEKGAFRKKEKQWNALSDMAKEFVQALLEVDPLKRLTVDQALKHPWIAQRCQEGRSYVTPLGLEGTEQEKSTNLNLDANTINALCNFAAASKFRRACMSLMAWSLSAEERSTVRDAFIELDIDRTGAIGLSQFKTILMSRFEVSEVRAQKIVEALATTNQGVIHYSEFLAAMFHTCIELTDEHFAVTFNRFDIENSGYLNHKDLMRVLGESFSAEEINLVLSSMDPGSTSKGKIPYETFKAYLKGVDDFEGSTSLFEGKSNLSVGRGASSATLESKPVAEKEGVRRSQQSDTTDQESGEFMDAVGDLAPMRPSATDDFQLPSRVISTQATDLVPPTRKQDTPPKKQVTPPKPSTETTKSKGACAVQ